jgi:predicted nucleotidyltransferase
MKTRGRRADGGHAGVSELSLFGSFARGEENNSSDIDFLVDLNPKSFDGYMDLKEFLESLFGRRVDLVMKSALKSRLPESILREAVRAA